MALLQGWDNRDTLKLDAWHRLIEKMGSKSSLTEFKNLINEAQNLVILGKPTPGL